MTKDTHTLVKRINGSNASRVGTSLNRSKDHPNSKPSSRKERFDEGDDLETHTRPATTAIIGRVVGTLYPQRIRSLRRILIDLGICGEPTLEFETCIRPLMDRGKLFLLMTSEHAPLKPQVTFSSARPLRGDFRILLEERDRGDSWRERATCSVVSDLWPSPAKPGLLAFQLTMRRYSVKN
jgi:hypothetical protein